MNTNSASKKAISMVCLIAGIILLTAALIQDISGSVTFDDLKESYE